MAKYTGDALEVSFDGGTTFTDDGLIRSVEITYSGDVVESTGASDTSKTYLATNKDALVRIEAMDDTAASNLRSDYPVGSTVTLSIQPQGAGTTGSPLPNQTGSGIVTNMTFGIPHDGVCPVTIDIQVTGGLTEGTQP